MVPSQTPPDRKKPIQLQDDFSGTPLSTLSRLGLGIYEKIRGLQDLLRSCPICGGSNCAIRHGLYLRRVVDDLGQLLEKFPVPRFLCQRRGVKEGCAAPGALTFSVLPSQVVPRRRLCLSRMVWLLNLWLVCGQPVSQVLEAFCSWVVHDWWLDAVDLRRLRRLFSQIYFRLQAQPVSGVSLASGLSGTEESARAVVQALQKARGGACGVVLGFHRHHGPALLFA